MHLAGVDIDVLESCNSTWMFDPERGRFRRVPRGTRLDFPASDSEWEPYFGIEVLPDTGAFVVHLNESGTKLLRAYQHFEPCEHCGVDSTGLVSLTEINST
jgi:hypothetical protein